MSTDIFTVAASAEPTSPISILMATFAIILAIGGLAAIMDGEGEVAAFLYFSMFIVVSLFALIEYSSDQWDTENREIISYSYNLEFTNPNQNIPDEPGDITAGYLLFNDTEEVMHCNIYRTYSPDSAVDLLSITCGGEPRPIREHLQEK